MMISIYAVRKFNFFGPNNYGIVIGEEEKNEFIKHGFVLIAKLDVNEVKK